MRQWKNILYEVENGEAIIRHYLGEGSDAPDAVNFSEPSREYAVPDTIEGFPVRVIGEDAFLEAGIELESIRVPGSVRRIGDFAFRLCMSLSTLIIAEGVEEIGEGIVSVTSVSQIRFPSTLKELKKPWEWGDIFWTIAAGNTEYETDGYALYHRLREGGERRYSEGDAAMQKWELVAAQKQDGRTHYEIRPQTVKIGQNAFEGQPYIEKVTFPDSIAEAGEESFASCENLREVYLNEGISKLGEDAFRGCVSLSALHFPASLTRVGRRAVTDTYGWSDRKNGISLVTVDEANPVFSADDAALYRREPGGGLKLIKYFGKKPRYEISKNVSCIGEDAFRRSNIRDIVIPVSVREAETNAFRECRELKHITVVEDKVTLYVPAVPKYRKEEVAGALCGGEGGGIFCYGEYDRLALGWSQIAERCRMAAGRLVQPVDLSDMTADKYRELIRSNLLTVMEEICRTDDLNYLAQLADAGMITEENIDRIMEMCAGRGCARLSGYLMNYRQKHLGKREMDFTF